jgi:maltose alpha-D-glucosyltransferase/alpha-amylase
MISDLWYKNAIIYCLSVGSYLDANGDGISDFSGLMRRLDYLHGLGVTAIWLMPFQPSPMRDDGYDITDYYGADPLWHVWAISSSSPMDANSAAFAY